MDRPRPESALTQILARVVEQQQRQVELQGRLLSRDLFWRNARVALIAIALIVGPLIYSAGLNSMMRPGSGPPGDYVAVVRIDGVIDTNTRASADRLTLALNRAFRDDNAVGVVLLIDSPGGSAVQSTRVHDRIVALRETHPDRPVWSIGGDQLTSGAYLVAAATDRICASPATLTGSIGVIYSSWGLAGVLDAVGIERRLLSSGPHKDRLDIFSALDADDRDKMTGLLGRVHDQFIEAVMARRGERFTVTPEVLFSGDFWVGEEAVHLGLVDELCSLEQALEALGATYTRDFSPRPSLFDRMSEEIAVRAAGLLRLNAGTTPMYMP